MFRAEAMMEARCLLLALIMVVVSTEASAEQSAERQVTFSAKNHCLDNNDNFSRDDRFLCYDTRDTVGTGIGNSQTIEMVEIATGAETVLYRPRSIVGEDAAPGVAAASFSPVENKVVFIHGPPLSEVAARGYYAKPNRVGAEVVADGSQKLTWLDLRDTKTSRPTTRGAHRGGTHRHEYSRDGKRIGFTYDDALLRDYDRTVGYMESNPDAPAPAAAYFAILVPVVPVGTSKPGEIEKAWGDSWVDEHGLMRAFIGKVRAENGVDYEQSLFLVDIPADVDITTADSGSATRFPSPPAGLRVRRLTRTFADGIIRGSPDGTRIAYLGHAPDGSVQVFVIPSDGSEWDMDPAKRPVQVTALPHGADSGPRWHPSGDWIACMSNNGIAVTSVGAGPLFGNSAFLTPHGNVADSVRKTNVRDALVWSHDGRAIAYNKRVPTADESGTRAFDWTGADFAQIFLVELPAEY
jgi:hypothetical protein